MKNFIKSIAFAIFSTSLMMASCEEELIGPEPVSTPVTNFEYFWKTFDTHYGLFEVKKIDWQQVHDEFRPRVNDQMSDEELYKVLSDMIMLLNDNHLNIYPTNGSLPVFPGGILRYRNGTLTILKVQEDYDIKVVKKYLTFYEQVTPNIGYGKFADNLAYINITGTDRLKTAKKQMEEIMGKLADEKGVVVDVRGFYGGFDPVSQYLAGCFASSRKLYMSTRKRNGPSHVDFTEPMEWFVEQETSKPFTRPAIILTSRFTQSAGETFTMAMKQFDHMQTLGDTTAGSLSDNPNFEMPNGWMFSVSVGDYRSPEGLSYEGIGLPPDVFIRTTREDLLHGQDKTLEKAIEILK